MLQKEKKRGKGVEFGPRTYDRSVLHKVLHDIQAPPESGELLKTLKFFVPSILKELPPDYR